MRAPLPISNQNCRTPARLQGSSPSAERYRATGGAIDQRTHLSTAAWPCAPNSRSQLSLARCLGSPRSHAVKRTSGSRKSHILIWVEGGQSGAPCQAHNSPSSTGTKRRASLTRLLDTLAGRRLQGLVLDLGVFSSEPPCPMRQAGNVRRRVALPGALGVETLV